MVADNANIAIANNIKSHTEFQLAYLHLTLACSKVEVKIMYNSTVNISQTVTDRTNIVNKSKVACGLSIVGFKFDLGLLQRSIPKLSRLVARLCTANKRLDLEVPILHTHMDVDKVRASANCHPNRQRR